MRETRIAHGKGEEHGNGEAHGKDLPHGKETGRTVKMPARQRHGDARQSEPDCNGSRRTAKTCCTAKKRLPCMCPKRTAKNPLPGWMSPCGLCRAPTDGKAVAVRIVALAVRFAYTAKNSSPVVASPWGLRT